VDLNIAFAYVFCCYSFCCYHHFGPKIGRLEGKVQEIKRMFFERAALIVKSLGGDYENLNGDFGNGAGPWLHGLAGIQQRR
jgi:hypothetical protein